MVETFFKTLKAELVWRTISRIEAASAIGPYIDGFYNPSATIRRSASSARFSS
jgi:putative transposase